MPLTGQSRPLFLVIACATAAIFLFDHFWPLFSAISHTTERNAQSRRSRSRRRNRSRIDFTLVVQASADRLQLVETLCEDRWRGPINLAVHRRLPPFLRPGGSDIKERCPRLKVLVVPSKPGGGELQAYPVNALRNAGIAAVKTSHFLVLDADFLPDRGLYRRLLSLSKSSKYSSSSAFEAWREALVVPALRIASFEPLVSSTTTLDTTQQEKHPVSKVEAATVSLQEALTAQDRARAVAVKR